MGLTLKQKEKIVGEFTNSESCPYSFPWEHLGVADKFLLKRTVMECLSERDKASQLGITPL